MPANFLQPGILFLSSATSSEFKALKRVVANARAAGYERLIDPACGALAMSHIGRQVGWMPEQMEASDVMFFSAVVGYAAMGKRLDDLHPRAEGFEDEDLGDPATALWVQATLRAEARSKVLYWQEVARSFRDQKRAHLDRLNKQVARIHDLMHGLTYTSEDLFVHLERVHTDPKVLILLNPPSTSGGYEKFYDTGGRFTWDEPEYEVFDVLPGYRRLAAMMENSPALWSVYMENQGGFEPEGAVFAKAGG